VLGPARDEARVDRTRSTLSWADLSSRLVGLGRPCGRHALNGAERAHRLDGHGESGRGRQGAQGGVRFIEDDADVDNRAVVLGRPARLGLDGLCRLFRLRVAPEPFPIRLSADPVGLLVLDARRVALDPYAECHAEVKRFLVG
jgi:hypothetical protein